MVYLGKGCKGDWMVGAVISLVKYCELVQGTLCWRGKRENAEKHQETAFKFKIEFAKPQARFLKRASRRTPLVIMGCWKTDLRQGAFPICFQRSLKHAWQRLPQTQPSTRKEGIPCFETE